MNERVASAPEWLSILTQLVAQHATSTLEKQQSLCAEIAEVLGDEGRAKAEELFAAERAKQAAKLSSMLGRLEGKSAPVLAAMTTRDPGRSVALRSASPVGFQHSTKPNGLVSSMFNARLAIDQLGIECSYDEFHDRLVIKGQACAVGGDTLENLDNQALMFRELVLDEFGIELKQAHAFEALKTKCLKHPFDPVRDYLDGLRWDGTPRIDRWLIDLCEAEDTPLNRAIGRKVLVAGVRRVRQPGCKFDYIMVLEGTQGAGKSTLLKLLAGEENFSDAEILGCNLKEQQELTRGVWIYEIAELVGLSKADVRNVKVFASKTSDRARAAYARDVTDRKRRGIFIATTNDNKYLRDVTGNRRFWPVEIGRIDLDAVTAIRDQLWAEASIAEATGEALIIPPALWPDAAAQQAARMEVDPWEDVLSTKLTSMGEAILKAGTNGTSGNMVLANNSDGNSEWRVSSAFLLNVVLQVSTDRQHNAHWSRLANVMTSLGWAHSPGVIRIGTKIGHGFIMSAEPDDEE